MKRKLFLIIMMAAVFFSGMAQNIGEVFFIYRNDGGFNAFFRDEVISIDYSYEDAEGNFYDEIVTQVVNTADSIYKIPIAAIDSVGFGIPNKVYKPGVIKLEGEIKKYIVSTDSLTIIFNGDTPSSILPKVDDNLFTDEISNEIPNGFIGKVKNVIYENDHWVVNCSLIDFEDVFESYYYNNIEVNSSRKKSYRSIAAFKEWERDWSPGPQEFVLTNYTTPHISTDPLGDFAFAVSNNHSITITPTYTVKFIRIVTPMRGTEVSLDITEKNSIDIDFAMSGYINWSDDFLSTKDIPILETPIPCLMVYVKFGLFFSADASILGEYHASQTYKNTIHCEGSSRSLFGTRASINGLELRNTHSGSLMVKGEVDLGLFGEIGVAFVSSKIASVACRGEAGVGIEGTRMLYKRDAEEALHSTNLYKTLQGEEIKFKGFRRIGLPVKLLWFSWPNKLLEKETVFARVSLVPNFSDTKLERDEEDNTCLFASTKVSGICLPVDLGFTLFEQESTKGLSPTYAQYGYMGMESDLYSSFFDVSSSTKYEVYPTVKLLGVEMLAEPMAKEDEIMLCPDDNHPHLIDFGLESGTKWACCNLGASKPENFGEYYAWGERHSKSIFTDENCAYISKIITDSLGNKDYVFKDYGSNIAGTFHDAATANWGSPWRMPSLEEFIELIRNTSQVWTSMNGVYGYKITGSNGSIFLPATGGISLFPQDLIHGIYWFSTIHGPYRGRPDAVDFNHQFMSWGNGSCCYYGHTIRPVRYN